MSSSVDRFDERARREAGRVGTTRIHRGELLRHPVYTRVLHWLVAISFRHFVRRRLRHGSFQRGAVSGR